MRLLGAKYAKNAFVVRALPRTSLGEAYSAPPDSLARFKGPTSKGRAGQGRREKGNSKKGGGEKGGEKEGREKKGKGHTVTFFPTSTPVMNNQSNCA